MSGSEPSISVIIPTLNEEARLGRTLGPLQGDALVEVIVVDGGSRDGTKDVALKAGAQVMDSVPGRAEQMNTGARAARGAMLLFLHADTLLPVDFAMHVKHTLEQPGVAAGAFELRIDQAGPSMRWIERLVRWRCRWRQLPYGDQGLFMTTSMFHEVDGFAALPVMEDYELVQRLKRRGRIAMAPACVLTSARRWQRHGVWRSTLINQFVIAGYRLGVDPQRLARWRGARQ